MREQAAETWAWGNALMIRIGFWRILNYKYNKEPPKRCWKFFRLLYYATCIPAHRRLNTNQTRDVRFECFAHDMSEIRLPMSTDCPCQRPQPRTQARNRRVNCSSQEYCRPRRQRPQVASREQLAQLSSRCLRFTMLTLRTLATLDQSPLRSTFRHPTGG